MQSNRLWRKASDTDMTPYRDPILDRWAQGLTAAEIAAEIPELTHDQVRNFVSNEALKRDEARDERIDPVFYSAKADSDDRLGSKHPTVKPVNLMQYLVRLVTPRGGTCLDPFSGTGTTGEAAIREGCRAILCEREPEYLADIERRCALILAGPDARRHATIKAKGKAEPAGPLFDSPPHQAGAAG